MMPMCLQGGTAYRGRHHTIHLMAEQQRLWDIAAGCGDTEVEFTPAP
ncbi:hypothetical protein [Streptomyces sp. WAC07149]|nr:hypothetical protein [Streptomyces sp. WAC07149]